MMLSRKPGMETNITIDRGGKSHRNATSENIYGRLQKPEFYQGS
jgi:hypothetical protein